MQQPIIQNYIKTNLDYDILELYFTKIHITVQDAYNFNLPATLNKNKGLILFGRGPIWLYLILYKKIKDADTVAWVAQYDVTTSTAVKIDEAYMDHATIQFEEFSNYLPTPENQLIIAFIGPPHSGKSVFMYNLFNQLLAINPVYIHRNFYIIKGCPDGEAFWSVDLPPTLLKQIRHKREHTDEFANEVAQQIKSASKLKKIIFVDCGGIIDERNKTILNNCTHAILISSEPAKAAKWRTAIDNLKYLADIDSYLDIPEKISQLKYIDQQSGTYFMDMTQLDRGKTNIHIPEAFLQYFFNQ